MDDDKRVGELDERSLELLREIVREGAETNKYPLKAAIDARYVREPWVIDDLLEHDLVRYAGFGSLIPTITGLRIAEIPQAQVDLEKAQQLLATLKELYSNKPIRQWTIQQVANAFGTQETVVSRLLAILGTYPGIIDGSSSSSHELLVQTFDLRPTFLREEPFLLQANDGPALIEEHATHHSVRDFLGLAHVKWSPEGVCLLIGPNGSGKSSLLQSLAFLRDFYIGGMSEAIKLHRGASGLKRIDADPKEDIFLAFGLGNAIWELRLPIGERIRSEFPGEIVKIGDTVFLRRGSNQKDWYLGPRRISNNSGSTDACLRIIWDAQSPPILEPLVRILSSFRLYQGYKLDHIRNGGTGSELDHLLDENGQNLFVVLRNWKVAPRKFDDQFAWVLSHLRRAFRGMIEDIEFAPPVGEIIPTTFYPPGSKTGLPMSRAAEGLLVGLLHLTAVAGAQKGSILAIEEMENFLHPHAIRCILAAMREMAERRNLTILLSTHSPLLMNAFRNQPEQVYVMEPGQSPLPIALDKLHDPEWLAHFELGDLYDRQEFGAPRRPQDG